MTKSCCTPRKVTYFKKLSQACTESIRQDFFACLKQPKHRSCWTTCGSMAVLITQSCTQ